MFNLLTGIPDTKVRTLWSFLKLRQHFSYGAVLKVRQHFLVGEASKIGTKKVLIWGREGFKNSEISADVLYGRPYAFILIWHFSFTKFWLRLLNSGMPTFKYLYKKS